MLCNKQCNNQVQQTNWGLYYRILTFHCVLKNTPLVAPRLRETGTPRNPAQRSRRSLWNTALLDIEQISSYYKNNNTRV